MAQKEAQFHVRRPSSMLVHVHFAESVFSLSEAPKLSQFRKKTWKMDQGQLLATLPAIECTSSNRTGSLDGRVRWYLYTHCSVGKMHYLLTVDGLNSAPPADKPAVTGAGCQPRVSLKPLQVDHRSALVLWKAGSTLFGCLRSEWLGVSPKGRGDL